MKEESSWGTAMLVAAVAAIGLSSQYGSKQATGTANPAELSKQTSSIATESANRFARGPCVEIEERLQAFLREASNKSIAAPPSCYGLSALSKDDNQAGAELRKNAQHLHFVIATLPDPLHTHFSLSFDLLAEAIQQGAADEQYVYDSSWLPWETDEAKAALVKDQDELDERKKVREEQPGILLFRRDFDRDTKATVAPYEEGLVVFIVAEEPTQGIHRIQFENATAWIAALEQRTNSSPAQYKLPERILGPSFSGSIPSLANLLLNTPTGHDGEANGNSTKPEISIYSGSVTSSRAVEWLINSTRAQLTLHFASFQQSDEQMLTRYCRYLQQSHFDLRNLAIVSEDETAYGGEYSRNVGSDPCDMAKGGPAQLYYPRDISEVRTAYQKQSIFTSGSSQPPVDNARRTLTADIADPEGKEHDTIRNYSGNQTALSQEAVLQQIVSLLRVHQSQYILLRSSNPLDQLFLSHYLRITYPQGRIVVLGPDLLLRRESGAAKLSGIMTLGTYPLLPWEPHWTRLQGKIYTHSHRVYSDAYAQGTYIATRFLIHLPHLETSTDRFLPISPPLDIPDYRVPFWLSEQTSAQGVPAPPTWLSVLGRDNFWPLAAIDEQSLPFVPETSHEPLESLWRTVTFWRANTAFENPKDVNWGPWPALPLSMKIALSILFFWAIFHFFCCWSPSVTIKPSHHAYFVCIPDSRHTHLSLLVLGSFLLSAMTTFLAWGCGGMSPDGEPLAHPRWFLSLLPLMWLLAGSSLVVNILRQSWKQISKQSAKQHKRGTSISDDLRIAVPLRPNSSLKWDIVKKKGNSILAPLLAFVTATLAIYFLVYFVLESALNRANRIPTYWRSMNLTSGVSPLIPLLALTAGLYMWFWYSLQGLALFGPDRPLLPSENTLEFTIGNKKVKWLRMFSREQAGAPVEALCWPFARPVLRIAIILFCCLGALSVIFAGGVPIRSLGARPYSVFVCLFFDACASLMLANAWQLLNMWLRLRQLLTFLDRLKLRRSMATFLEITWGSVWKISGNIFDMRYKLLVNQLDCVTLLRNSICELQKILPPHPDAQNLDRCAGALDRLNEARFAFAEWYSEIWDKPDVCDQDKLKELNARLQKPLERFSHLC